MKRTDRKLVIWAPHWTIDKSNKSISISTFLDYYNVMLEIVEKYREKIDFVLKPHPLLIDKLLEDKFLGEEKTKLYFDKWNNGINTEVIDENYIELFNKSDAIIHDSVAFVLEYLYTGKPSAYLVNEDFSIDFFNDFGKQALECYKYIECKNDIIIFLDDLLASEDSKREQKESFYNQYLRAHHHSASDKVYRDIISSLLI